MLPVEIDDTADAAHLLLAFAIVGAFLEARRRSALAREAALLPHEVPIFGHSIGCENFA